MADPYFFGYGSLVNSATHDFPDAQPASIKGWRRAWRHTDLRQVAFLTVIPDAQCQIEGMIAHVPGDDWAALDRREWAYDRVPATHAVTHGITRDLDIAVYVVPPDRHSAAAAEHPVLLSYLDVVVQGYLQVFGQEGADRFFATTDGWDTPILNDRANPRYPRHQTLTRAERGFVDDSLARIGATVRDGGADWL